MKKCVFLCMKYACFHVFSFSAYFFPHDNIAEKGPFAIAVDLIGYDVMGCKSTAVLGAQEITSKQACSYVFIQGNTTKARSLVYCLLDKRYIRYAAQVFVQIRFLE